MMIKIGDYLFSPEDQPIMAILSEEDKRIIAKGENKSGGMKYVSFPKDAKKEDVLEFMKTDKARRMKCGFSSTHFLTKNETLLLVPVGSKPEKAKD